jgi:integrase
MSATTVTLYIRPRKMPDGRRPYLQPIRGKNNRIRAGWAIYQGTEIEVPGADYYLRYRHGGKSVFRRIGRDLSVALVEQLKQEKTLEAIAVGVEIPAPVCAPAKSELVSERIKDFLIFLDASGRAPNTIRDFAYYLHSLDEHLGPKQMAEITKDDLLGWAKMWRDQVREVNGRPVRQIADSTIWYRLRKVRTFLLHFGFDILKRKDFPRFDEKVPDTYSKEQLHKFFAACGSEERYWYSLAFGTGMRLGELAHLTWEDVDLQRRLITIQASTDWKTKTRKSRRVPIPDDLVAILRTRRLEYPGYNYVIGDGAKPQTDLLKPLKLIAYQASLNCGHCQTKSGVSCADGPCCKKFTVQKLRRSYATHLHEGGTSINTLRVLLGHSSPAPILRYLAPQDIQSHELLANLATSISSLTCTSSVGDAT